MAFQEVSTKVIKLHEEQYKNKPLTGYYLGSKKSDKYENSRIHRFQTKKDGKFVSVYGTGQLNYQLAEVPVGTLARVTFLGKSTMDTKYGKNKEVNTFKTEVDPEDVLSSAKLAAVQTEAPDDNEDDFDDAPPAKDEPEEDLPF